MLGSSVAQSLEFNYMVFNHGLWWHTSPLICWMILAVVKRVLPAYLCHLPASRYQNSWSFEYEEKIQHNVSYILFLRVQVYFTSSVPAKLRVYLFIHCTILCRWLEYFSAKCSFCFITIVPYNWRVCFYADPLANLLTSGPYGLIFASFVPFYFDIPVSTRFQFHGVRFSDKSVIYLAGVLVKENTCAFHVWMYLPFLFFFPFLFTFFHIYPLVSLSNPRDPILALVLQLLLSSWKRSILPGICGILAGSLYRLSLFGIRKAKVGLLVSLLPFCKWMTTEDDSLDCEASNFLGLRFVFKSKWKLRVGDLINLTKASLFYVAEIGWENSSVRNCSMEI